MKMYFRRWFLLLLMCWALEATAGVNIKNGNFFLSYTDLDLTNKKGIDITRSYNSSSIENGLFGFGWGSMLETRLYIIGDGNLVVKYWGGGTSVLYTYDRPDEALLNSCIDQLVTAALENEDLDNNPSAVSDFRLLLRQSINERVRKWIQYTQLQLVTLPSTLPVTQWISNMFQRERIALNGNSFIQMLEDGSSLRFNKDGYLIGSSSTSGNPVFELTYKNGNRLSAMKDKGGNIFYFTLTNAGKVEQIQSKHGSSRYWYQDDLLIRSVDAGKNEYRYAYDSAYNMIAVHYTDGTSMYIEYEEATNFCKKVTDRKGIITEYVYKFFYDENGEVNSNHFATYVLTQTPGNTVTDSAYYEYETQEQENGEEYQYRYFQNRNGNTFEEINDEQCRWPLVIRKNTQELRFRYSPQCGLLGRESDSLRIEAVLDTLTQQPLQLIYIDKISGDTLVKRMELNKAGNPVLIRFGNTNTQIVYNNEQLPIEVSFEKGVLLYKYDASKRIVQVQAGSAGVLDLQYDQNNELVNHSSKGGAETARKIYELYEAALQRIKNARIHYEFIPIIH